MTPLAEVPAKKLACEQYERARNTLAFQVVGAAYRWKNQHGTVFLFPDNSWLAVSHTSNRIKWGPEPGKAFAVKKIWDDRGSRRDRKSRMEQSACLARRTSR